MSIVTGVKKLLGVPESDENDDVFADPARKTESTTDKPAQTKTPARAPRASKPESEDGTTGLPPVYTRIMAVYEWTGEDGHTYVRSRHEHEAELAEDMGEKYAPYLQYQLKEGILKKWWYYCDFQDVPRAPLPDALAELLEDDLERQNAERKAAIDEKRKHADPSKRKTEDSRLMNPEAVTQLLATMDAKEAHAYIEELLKGVDLAQAFIRLRDGERPQPPTPEEQNKT